MTFAVVVVVAAVAAVVVVAVVVVAVVDRSHLGYRIAAAAAVHVAPPSTRRSLRFNANECASVCVCV